jgi:CheY-like chemotaxis protein
MAAEHQKILVIDDEASMLEIASEVLGEKGYIIETAKNGREGFEKFERTDFDAIVTDLRMPVMDGVSMIVAVRKKNTTIPIIAITGTIKNEEFLESALQLGADLILRKPLSFTDLADTLEKLLARKKREIPPETIKK